MEQQIYSVYDSKAAAYLQPFYLPRHELAERAFAHAACTEGHAFNNFAGDYTLFWIGTWDEENGILTNAEAKLNMGTALEHRAHINEYEGKANDGKTTVEQ